MLLLFCRQLVATMVGRCARWATFDLVTLWLRFGVPLYAEPVLKREETMLLLVVESEDTHLLPTLRGRASEQK